MTEKAEAKCTECGSTDLEVYGDPFKQAGRMDLFRRVKCRKCAYTTALPVALLEGRVEAEAAPAPVKDALREGELTVGELAAVLNGNSAVAIDDELPGKVCVRIGDNSFKVSQKAYDVLSAGRADTSAQPDDEAPPAQPDDVAPPPPGEAELQLVTCKPEDLVDGDLVEITYHKEKLRAPMVRVTKTKVFVDLDGKKDVGVGFKKYHGKLVRP